MSQIAATKKLADPANKVDRFGSHFLKEVRKCEALIIENLALTTSWTFFALTLRIMHLAELTDLPKDIFKHHFWRLAITHNVLMLHLLLIIKLNCPELFSQNDRRIILNQLLSHSGNTQL